MRRIPSLLALALVLPWWAAAAMAQIATGAVVTTPQVRAELVAHAPEGVAPGRPLALGLLIDHQPQWHTYWKNPGDSGLPTLLNWDLPPGVEVGEIDWPTPSKLPLGPLMNFGYEGRLLLPVQAAVPADFAADTLEVRLRAEWLVCKDVCIPEDGEFVLRLPAQAASVGHAAAFEAARTATPVPLAQAAGTAAVDGSTLRLRVEGLPAAWQGRPVSFFPETAGVIHNAAVPPSRWDGATWLAEVPLDPQRSASPEAMPAVFTTPGEVAGVRTTLAVAGPWPAVGAPGASVAAAAPTALDSAGTAAPPLPPAGGSLGLGLALLFALVGGALLNLMPCVFPVLSLKVLGFAQHAGERRRLLAGGLAYTGGVVLSFLALAALLLALRAGGEQLGWGFQLQSPVVVAALAALFTLIGLNLAGVFEVGGVLPDRVATLQLRHPMLDSALTGVLAVAVAAPCTAPFMGASLGLAVTLPAAQALSVFAALGLGMALPYLAASAWPAVARALPRPGPWMVTFRGLMAFPMFATVVWLVWVLGQQVGIDGAAALLGTLVALAFLAWALGGAGHSRRVRAGLGGVGALLLAAALAWTGPALKSDTVLAGGPAATGDGWQPWSAAAVAAAQAAGRPVFVDFTAAWCVTCQFNKRTTLADVRVADAFAEHRVVLMRADWTRRDDAISAELSRLGRSGVPVYALYAPGAERPRLLSEILSVDEIRTALAALPALPTVSALPGRGAGS
jgi:thiol:disulfide interchange protein/DsbC/DsbD-like thiol-disulfide interchange protein